MQPGLIMVHKKAVFSAPDKRDKALKVLRTLYKRNKTKKKNGM